MNVVHGRPRQPAISADVKYWFMTMGSCAGASRDMRSTSKHTKTVRTCMHNETIIKIYVQIKSYAILIINLLKKKKNECLASIRDTNFFRIFTVLK